MNYIVFESGSRAGLSAEVFFMDYCKRHPQTPDRLYTSDLDPMFSQIQSPHPRIEHICDDVAFDILAAGDACIFPAEELTRQGNSQARTFADQHHFSKVETWYYDKCQMNQWLAERAIGSKIAIPRTFPSTSICVRPNSMSAGTRGVTLSDTSCITERINICHEYVVDVLRSSNTIQVYPREVTLKNGYDRYVKLIDSQSQLASDIVDFIKQVAPQNEGLMSDIFHLQLACDDKNQLYYIESSKRISGTSLVNVFRGMRPFDLLAGEEPIDTLDGPFSFDKWYRCEDFMLALQAKLQ